MVYDDLAAQPEDTPVELVQGQLVNLPAPLPRHAHTQRSVGRFIGGPFHDDDGRGGPGGWWILPEVDVRFTPHDVARPDVAGWRKDRLPDPWDMRPIDVTPDWLCEVLSPSNVAHDRVYKRWLYAKHQVPYYWLIDPQDRTLEALRLEGDKWLELGVYGDSDTVAVEPFAAIELEVGRLFPPKK